MVAMLPLRAHATAIYSGVAAVTTSLTGPSITATSEAVPDAADHAEFLSLLVTGDDLSGAFTTGGGTMLHSAAVDGSATAPGDYSPALIVARRKWRAGSGAAS